MPSSEDLKARRASRTVSDFSLKDLGDGHFALSGEMSFDTAERILQASEQPFEEHTRLEIDLSGVTLSDSAGLALLLEWVTWANHTVREIRFSGCQSGFLRLPKRQKLTNF